MSDKTAPYTPAIGDIFHVTCHRMEKVSGGFGFDNRLVRSRDFEHIIFEMIGSDDVVVVGKSLTSGSGASISLRRDDFTFTPVGDQVLSALGIKRQAAALQNQ